MKRQIPVAEAIRGLRLEGRGEDEDAEEIQSRYTCLCNGNRQRPSKVLPNDAGDRSSDAALSRAAQCASCIVIIWRRV